LIGLDGKPPPQGQNGAIDPTRTSGKVRSRAAVRSKA